MLKFDVTRRCKDEKSLKISEHFQFLKSSIFISHSKYFLQQILVQFFFSVILRSFSPITFSCVEGEGLMCKYLIKKQTNFVVKIIQTLIRIRLEFIKICVVYH